MEQSMPQVQVVKTSGRLFDFLMFIGNVRRLISCGATQVRAARENRRESAILALKLQAES